MIRKAALALLTVLLGGLVVAGTAVAGEPSKFLLATGQEITFNVIDPGTATCIGGIATGDPYYPCIDSRRIRLAHQVVQARLLSDPEPVGPAVPLLSGVNTMTIDCSLDGNLKGACWGTFEWAVDDTASWAGVLSGTFDFATITLDFQLVGRGFGGAVDGLQLHYDCFYPGVVWVDDVPVMIGDFVARVHDPKAR